MTSLKLSSVLRRAAMLLVQTCATATAQYSFRAIPELGINAVKVSGDGRVVVGPVAVAGRAQAAYWTENTGIVLLRIPISLLYLRW
jgi:hypothetical protein